MKWYAESIAQENIGKNHKMATKQAEAGPYDYSQSS